MNKDLKEQALKYAARGFAVFPLKPRDKRPATHNGFNDATTDTQQVRKWWEENPSYNIGIATGGASKNLLVVDLDEDEAKGCHGIEICKEWFRQRGIDPPMTAVVKTGRGGMHLYYYGVYGCKTGVYKGVDVRGNGGYVVAPPSVHPNGNTYEWKNGIEHIVAIDQNVRAFIEGSKEVAGVQGNFLSPAFHSPETIPAGERTNALVKLLCSQQAKGLSDAAIYAAVRAENTAKCNPPLTEEELRREVFPALKRYQKGSSNYSRDGTVSKLEKDDPPSTDLEAVSGIAEKEAEWLVKGYIPKGQITTLGGDGGVGKTTIWCGIVAAVSSGSRCFLEQDLPADWGGATPQKTMIFSSEDSIQYTLKRRLRKAGADLNNVLTIDIADERFRCVKFNNPFLDILIEKHRPALCVFDPIQGFIPPNLKMGDRNAMRDCLSKLVGLGEKYGTTFLLVVHANKQSGVWGRKRMADSADIWDISRSVLMMGETKEKGMRYISQEKSNYGERQPTVLLTLNDEVIEVKEVTDKHDRDFVVEADFSSRQAPAREEAKELILDYLKDGEKEAAELDGYLKALNIGSGTINRAKKELKDSNKIKISRLGFGKGSKYMCGLKTTAL
ncbi:MAG: bifunctional DNA primase/polymerase [Stomatobaculum sp.]